MSMTKPSTFTKISLLCFQHTNVLNDKGNQRQKSFGHLGHFFLITNHRICIIRRILLRNYPSLMKTLFLLHCTLHSFCICCVAEPLLIFGISSNDFAISPESLSTCLTKTGKNLSSSSLLPSVADPYQRVNSSSSFSSLVICFATAPVSICVVFVRPHRYLFTILESGNMFRNCLAA